LLYNFEDKLINLKSFFRDNSQYFISYSALLGSQVLTALTILVLAYISSKNNIIDDFGVYAFAFSLGVFSSVISEAGTNSIIIQRMAKKDKSKVIINFYSGSFTAIKAFLYIVTSSLVFIYAFNFISQEQRYFFYLYQLFGFFLCLQPIFIFIILNKLLIHSFLIIISKAPVLIYVFFIFNPLNDSFALIPLIDILSITFVLICQITYLKIYAGIDFIFSKKLTYHLLFALKFFYLSNLVSSTYHRMHYFFIAQIGTPSQLGVIAVIDRFISIWGQIYNPAMTLIIPKLVRSKDGSKIFTKRLKAMLKFILFSFIVISVIFYLNDLNIIYDHIMNNIYLLIIFLAIIMLITSILGYPVSSIHGKYTVSQLSIYIGFLMACAVYQSYSYFSLSINPLIYSILIIIIGELSICLIRLIYLFRLKI